MAVLVQPMYPSQGHRVFRSNSEVGQFPVRRTGDEVLRDDLFGASLFDNPAALEQDGPFAQPAQRVHLVTHEQYGATVLRDVVTLAPYFSLEAGVPPRPKFFEAESTRFQERLQGETEHHT